MKTNTATVAWFRCFPFLACGLLLIAAVPTAHPAPAPDESKDSEKPWKCRSKDARDKLLKADGGTKESEEAVALGLEWLALHQSKDGSWSLDKFHQHAHEKAGDLDAKEFKCDCDGQGMDNDIAATAFGLLPFLGAGYTHEAPQKKIEPDYHKTGKAGIDFLMSKQKRDGDFGGGMYAQGLATIAFCEAYGMTDDRKLKASAQDAVDFLVAAQHKAGGWRYKPKELGDTSVTGWQLQALHAGKLAGLKVPKETWENAASFLDSVMTNDGGGYGYTGPQATPTMTASALLGRLDLGWTPKKKEWRAGVETLKNSPPGAIKSIYYYYYATQDVLHTGGETWEAWNPKLRDSLIDTQDQGKEPKHAHQKGTWSPVDDAHAKAGGRLMTTSLSLLTLEVYYRYPRVKDAKEEKGDK